MEAGVDLYLEVYIDVIFLINFIMDIILLLIVKKILKCSGTILRILGGAAVGAAGACVIALVPNLNGFVQFLISYVIICMLMICIAYHMTNWKSRIRAVIVLYISTFFLGGIMNSLYYYSNLGYYFNELISGNLFQNRNTKYFIFAAIVTMASVPVFIETFFMFRRGNTELYQSELSYSGKSVRLVGLLDTGNSLHDPIYGKPVVIAEYAAIEPLLTVPQANKLRDFLDMAEGKLGFIQNDYGSSTSEDDTEEPLKVMMVPYRSIGKKSGLLPAITMNRIIIWNGKDPICNEKVLTAVSRNRLSSKSEYQIILHRDIM
jgi:stage II sporulation protein GA (sporulation sigma-E factor processing peptidase)